MKILKTVEPRYHNCSVHTGKKKMIKIKQIECLCNCGNRFITDFKLAESGQVFNCGCSSVKPKYSSVRRNEYKAWFNMIDKCTNADAGGYQNFGGRGISVSKRWEESFESFLMDMGKRPSNRHEIVRLDLSGNYKPENCLWAVCSERNRSKRGNLLVKYNGKELPLVEVSKDLNTTTRRLHKKIRNVVRNTGDDLRDDYEIIVRKRIFVRR